MISIQNVSKTFHTNMGDVRALRSVNIEIEKGEIYGIIGHSGSGKSTLVRCINRLETIDEGTILVDGDDMMKLTEQQLRKKRQRVGMIFQQFNLLKNATVYQNVAMPLSYAGKSRQEVRERVTELLSIVDLADKKDNYPNQLSGGQKQRVAIARALANDPEVLLSDEATSALDPETTKSILELLRRLNNELNITIVVIAHQMEVIKDTCRRVTVLSHGKVVEQGNTIDVFTEPKHPVTCQFSNSLFQSDRLGDVLRSREIREKTEQGASIVRLLFRHESANQSIITWTCQRFRVNANIIFGNIVLFGSEPVGSLYILLEGEQEEKEKAMDFIRDLGVVIQPIDETDFPETEVD